MTITYVASRTDAFARLLLRNARPGDRLLNYLFFGLLATAEVLLAPHNPLLDARIVSATAAGLLGGPVFGAVLGVTTGAISLAHSPWSIVDCAPAVIAGLLGGAAYSHRPAFGSRVLAGFLVGMLGHGLWLTMRLSHDYVVGSWDSVVVQYLFPMLLSGSGVALFLVIVGDMRAQRERIERSELAKAISLANRVLPSLSAGLDESAAEHTATLVRRLTGVPAVAVTVDGKLLAHVGEAAEYHRNSAIVPEVAIQAMADGERHVTEKRSTWCDHPGCPFGCAVAAPLSYRGKRIGSIVLFETRYVKFRPEVVDLGAEVAQFLVNYQLQTAEIAKQAQAVSRAELKALQAQVHPHFLFNALNTLAGLCEINPSRAADLTVRLGEFFRSSFRSERELVSSVGEEMSVVRSYLEIERARFGDRLAVVEEIEPQTEGCEIPSFSIQPLAENAVVHGVSKRPDGGTITIRVRIKGSHIYCCVTDNGAGFDVGATDWRSSSSHALSILAGRLERIYGQDHRLLVRSRIGRGTMVCIRIPVSRTQ